MTKIYTHMDRRKFLKVFGGSVAGLALVPLIGLPKDVPAPKTAPAYDDVPLFDSDNLQPLFHRDAIAYVGYGEMEQMGAAISRKIDADIMGLM